MNRMYALSKNEDGFVLITALIMLVILTLLGTFALNTTIFELQISGNDKVAKETFYKADGGVQAGIELIEQNLGCPDGFTTGFTTASNGDEILPIGGVDVYDLKFAYDESMVNVFGAPATVQLKDLPANDIRSIRILDDPANRPDDTLPLTNLATWGVTKTLPGSAIQMVSGYEGRGKGAAGGGAIIEYDLHSQHKGVQNSETKVAIQWRHMIGQEGNCNY